MELLHSSLLGLCAWLLRATLQGSLLICLILLIRQIGRNRLPAKWHYCLWLVLLVRLSLPWAPQSRLSIHNVLPLSRWIATVQASMPVTTRDTSALARRVGEGADRSSSAPVASSGGPSENTTQEQGVAPQPSGTSPAIFSEPRRWFPGAMTILSMVWMIGVVALAGYVLVRSLWLWWAIGGERPVTSQGILDLLEDAKMQMGVRTIVGVVVTDKVKTPALFGFVRPRVLLPMGALELLSPDQLSHVFLHELAHLRRRDIFISWWAALLQVLHWFNPLIWLALRRMRADQEMACDALVLSRIGPEEPVAYGCTMVRLLERFSHAQYLPSVAGILEDTSQIERRIIMIGRYKRHSRRATLVAAATFALLTAATLTDARSARVDVLDEKVPLDLQRNVLAYYSFDRDGGTRAVDISGMDFHGTVRGAEYIEEGRLGGAMRFDGEDDFIQIAPEVSLRAFTVAAWVRTQTSALNNRRIFMLDQGKACCAFESNTRGGTEFGVAGGSYDGATAVTEYDWRLEPGRWTHVAVTFTGSEVRLYRDGVRTETGPVTMDRLTGTAYVGGMDAHDGRYWSGAIDEFAVFSRALTDGELEHLYAMTFERPEPQRGVPPTGDITGPVAMWRFDGDARDSVGNRHGVVHGAMPTAGVSGQAYSFDGQDDNVVISDVYLHSFSVSAWVKTETRSINNRQIFLLTDGARYYSLQGNVGGSVGVDVGADEEVNEYDWQFVVDRWTHLVLTHDGRRFGIFKDGMPTQEGSLRTAGVTGTVYIGGSDKHDQGYWRGGIDEVSVWERPLSSSEVKRLFDSYAVDGASAVISEMPSANVVWGRWEGLAVDKPEDGTSRDDLVLELKAGDDGRVTGTATGDFVGPQACSIEDGQTEGDRMEFYVRHRTGIPMRVLLELRNDFLQGEALPVDSDGDRCDIRLKRAGP